MPLPSLRSDGLSRHGLPPASTTPTPGRHGGRPAGADESHRPPRSRSSLAALPRLRTEQAQQQQQQRAGRLGYSEASGRTDAFDPSARRRASQTDLLRRNSSVMIPSAGGRVAGSPAALHASTSSPRYDSSNEASPRGSHPPSARTTATTAAAVSVARASTVAAGGNKTFAKAAHIMTHLATNERHKEPAQEREHHHHAASVASRRRDGAASTIAASNRSAARLDVVLVGEVDRDDRELLDEGDKRARRMVYDALRASAPEFAKGRGRIVPLEIEPAVPGGVGKRVQPLDYTHLNLTSVIQMLSVPPRSASILSMGPQGAASASADSPMNASSGSAVGDAENILAARRRRQEEQRRRDEEQRRAAALFNFGDDATAFTNALRNAQQQQQESAAASSSNVITNADAPDAAVPVFKPGATRLWGAKGNAVGGSFIVIRERDSTYVIDKNTIDDDDVTAGVRGGKSEFVSAADDYLNAVQLDLVEALPDASKFVYLVEREARPYLYELAVRRVVLNPFHPHTGAIVDAAKCNESPAAIVAAVVGSNATPQAIVQYASNLAAAPTYKCGNLKLAGNDIPVLNVITFARTLIFATQSARNAMHASFVDVRHNAVSLGQAYSPKKIGTPLPLQYLAVLDLSNCNLERIEFPGATAAPSPFGTTTTTSSSQHFAGVNVANHPALVLSQSRNHIAEGAPVSPLDSLVVDRHVRGGTANQARRFAKEAAAKKNRSKTAVTDAAGSSQHQHHHLLVPIPPAPADLVKHVAEQRAKEREMRRKTGGGAGSNKDADDGSDDETTASLPRRLSRRASTFARSGNPHLPYRGKVAHWSVAPCAPLRFLTTLLLHGNRLQDYREVLTFAALSSSTLTALTWHGNPGVDAAGPAASEAAQQVLPRLATLNFTPLMRNKQTKAT